MSSRASPSAGRCAHSLPASAVSRAEACRQPDRGDLGRSSARSRADRRVACATSGSRSLAAGMLVVEFARGAPRHRALRARPASSFGRCRSESRRAAPPAPRSARACSSAICSCAASGSRSLSMASSSVSSCAASCLTSRRGHDARLASTLADRHPSDAISSSREILDRSDPLEHIRRRLVRFGSSASLRDASSRADGATRGSPALASFGRLRLAPPEAELLAPTG